MLDYLPEILEALEQTAGETKKAGLMVKRKSAMWIHFIRKGRKTMRGVDARLKKLEQTICRQTQHYRVLNYWDIPPEVGDAGKLLARNLDLVVAESNGEGKKKRSASLRNTQDPAVREASEIMHRWRKIQTDSDRE